MAITRWVKSRKLALMASIDSGEITREEAMRAHGISAEELDGWYRAKEKHGPGALRVTHATRYRKKEKPVG